MENENKPAFLSTPAGVWGLAIPVIAIILAFVFAGPLVAAVSTGLGVMFGILGFGFGWGILAVIALVFINGILPGGWLLLKYQVFCNNLRKSIIDENPLTILRIWKEKAAKRMADLRAQKDEVKKQENVVLKANNTFKSDFSQFQKEASTLENDPERSAMFKSAKARMATAYGMAQKTGSQLTMIHTQYTRVDETIKDLENMYRDMEYEEKALIIDYEVSGALDKVWSSIRRLFKGENEEDQMREQAIASINNKYAERMGRVESAVDDCKGKMDELKLQKEIKENDGTDLYNQLKGISVDQISTPALTYTPVNSNPFVAQSTNSYAGIAKK